MASTGKPPVRGIQAAQRIEQDLHEPVALGIYPKPPDRKEIERLGEIVKKTQQPELLPGISLEPIDFNKYGPDQHVILRKLDIERKKRPAGDLVPCALCGHFPKFLDGRLVWSPDRYIRAVGHVCASNPDHFGAAWQGLLSNHEARIAQWAFEDILLSEVPILPPLLSSMHDVVEYCKRLQGFRRKLFKDAPELHKHLLDAVNNHGGALVVERRLPDSASAGYRTSIGGNARYEHAKVSSLRGQKFVVGGFNPESRAKKLTTDLARLAASVPNPLNEGEMLDGLARMSDGDREHTAHCIVDVHKRGCELREWLKDASQFLRVENLQALKTWLEHDLSPVDGLVYISKTHDVKFDFYRGNWFRWEGLREMTTPPALESFSRKWA